MKQEIYKEACVTTVAQAIAAVQNGADQLELCEHLEWDGITPSEDLLQAVLSQVKIPVKVLVRPRKGNFVYSAAEMDVIKKQIKVCQKYQIAGIVTGMLESDNQLNIRQLRMIVKVTKELPVFLHKAIDATPDLLQATQQLREQLPEIAGILTSGGAATAAKGIPVLKQLLHYDASDFSVVVAGKVTKANIADLHEQLGAQYYHGRLIV